VEATCRRALERRYRLMPYLYTLFREASVTGHPVARPLFFADPRDPGLRGEDESFLLGEDLLVAALTDPGWNPRPDLPAGIWRRIDLGVEAGDDPDLPGLYLRGGAILPVGPVIQYVDQLPLDPLELFVCLDGEGRAEGTLYEDAGDGFGYREGEYRLVRYTARVEGSEVVVRRAVEEGGWPLADRNVVIHVVEDGGAIRWEGEAAERMRVRSARK
jgi:alpha-glucosidase